MAGINNKTTLSMVYSYYTSTDFKTTGSDHQQHSLATVIGAYILVRTYRDKAIRCLSKTGDDLIKELETSRANRQWKPIDHPDWILFELEQRIFIREKQYKIIKELLDRNGCIQLQMGEGKTSVILPLIFNMKVINFWLSNYVLPTYTKQFPSKLFATPWDLTAKNTHPTTGFSGTNDTRWLLPLSIEQKDLPELKYTNFEVINFIVSQSTPSSPNIVHMVNKETILNQLLSCTHGGRVLIDVGALMVGKSNEEVAKKWLAMSKADGALYFDNNRLTAIDTQGRKYPHHLSPFAQKLDRVVVYLDDYHTRGVDIKFPIGTHAFVTIGPKVTKERLFQGCMRMRKLGKGHTICFLVSDQLDIPLTLGVSIPTVDAILYWVTRNTIDLNTSSVAMWATQGMMYARSSTAMGVLEEQPSLFSELSSLPEITTLLDMYGSSFGYEFANKVINLKIQYMEKKLSESSAGKESLNLLTRISKRADLLVSDIKIHSTMLDEEQEREYEVEEEREHQKQLPGVGKANIPKTDPILIELAKGSTSSAELGGKTHFPKNDTNNKEDDFMKQPNFAMVVWEEKKSSPCWIILMSQHEANKILPIIRRNKSANRSLHQMAPIETDSQRDLMTILHTGYGGNDFSDYAADGRFKRNNFTTSPEPQE
eukprot:gene4291-5010_t